MSPASLFRHASIRLQALRSLTGIALACVLAACAPGGEAPSHEAKTSEDQATPSMAAGEIMVDARRQQLIGVTYGTVERRDVQQVIRTVGTVAYDETTLADVNLKFHGWIEDLYADETGILVQQGQELLKIYSPELVSTQEEYLSAFQHYDRLRETGHPDALEGARRLVDAARQRLAYWDIDEQHLRDLENSGITLRTLPVHSPATGYIIEKNVILGSHVMEGHLLYRLASLDTVWVLADVYEYELPLVAVGQAAVVELAYLPDVSFRGRVAYIYPYLESTERTVKVRIELPNPEHSLKAGMYANVSLTASRSSVLVVPQSAVIDSGARQVVFLASGDGRFAPQEVRLGARFPDYYEVLEGLQEGDQIVTSGNFLIDSESQLATGMKQMGH